MQHTPYELSGGQQQRVSIARALANDPTFLLCDEPTGNLDSKMSTQIMEILSDLHKQGRTLVMVTHNPETAEYADRVIIIRDGEIVGEE
jgi:putative ABC transport system ATP-binding protein